MQKNRWTQEETKMFNSKNEKITVSNEIYATVKELISANESVLISTSWYVIEVTITEIQDWIELFGEDTLIDFANDVCAHILDNSDYVFEL